eukprot:m.230798 g.230798  ORF g.230798 m.230798 type:complete len:118 (-) comp13892_c1_seq17:349-702(-)
MLHIVLQDPSEVPETIKETIKGMELFSAAAMKYVDEVEEFMGKAMEIEKTLKSQKKKALNGYATNEALISTLSSNIITFRAVPMRVSEASSIVEDELFAMKRGVMRSRRSSVRFSRK